MCTVTSRWAPNSASAIATRWIADLTARIGVCTAGVVRADRPGPICFVTWKQIYRIVTDVLAMRLSCIAEWPQWPLRESGKQAFNREVALSGVIGEGEHSGAVGHVGKLLGDYGQRRPRGHAVH